MCSPVVERVSNSLPHMHRTTVVVYSGCMSVFIEKPPSDIQRHRLFYYARKEIEKGGRRRGRPQELVALNADALQLAEELRVGAGLFELLYKELYLLIGTQSAQDAPDLPDPLRLGRFHEELLFPRTRVLDVDGRVDPLVRHLAVEPELHVARALELLEDDLVHPAPRLDQRGRHDRQRAAVLDVPGRPEELLRGVKRRRVDAAGEDASRGRGREVVGPRKPGYAVEQDHHVFTLLDEPLDPFQDEFRHRYVVLGGLVEGRGDDRGLAHAPLPVGDLLRALVGQEDEELGLRIVHRDALRYLLEDRGLTGLRRRDDETTLTLAYGGHEVYNAWGYVVRLPLQAQPLVRVKRREVVEVGPVAALLGLVAVDRFDTYQGRVLLALAGLPDLANYVVPAPEVEPLYLRG